MWFAINARLFGVNHPAPWHLMKILLQVVAVLLCFRVAQLLTGEVVVAMLAAAIFGIMPAHVEPVVWASAIPEPLSTVFELAALIFLIQREAGMVARTDAVGALLRLRNPHSRERDLFPRDRRLRT